MPDSLGRAGTATLMIHGLTHLRVRPGGGRTSKTKTNIDLNSQTTLMFRRAVYRMAPHYDGDSTSLGAGKAFGWSLRQEATDGTCCVTH